MFKCAGLDASNPAVAKRLWNCDEMTFSTSTSASKILACGGAKAVHEVGGGSGREYITVHSAGSSSGERLPFIILYKVKKCLKGGQRVVQQVDGVSESGWMDASNFLSWLKNLFLRAVAHLIDIASVLLFGWSPFTHQFGPD